MRISKKRVEDVLQTKQRELNECMARFDNACSIVTSTVDNLKQLNSDIQEKIEEIDDYRNKLGETRNDLDKTKQRNEKVIKNFSALLGVE